MLATQMMKRALALCRRAPATRPWSIDSEMYHLRLSLMSGGALDRRRESEHLLKHSNDTSEAYDALKANETSLKP